MISADALRTLERDLRRRPRGWESWLVYADYLSERGDPRGRLIALLHQLATAKLDAKHGRALAAELDELREREQSNWQLDGAPESFELEWDKGFVVGLTAPLSEQVIEPLAAVLAHPQARLLSRVCLRASAGDSENEDFEFDGAEDYEPPPVAEAMLAGLFALELGSLSSLAIQYAPLGLAGAKLLADCERLGELRELDLRYAALGHDGIALLVASPLLPGLSSLMLQRNRLGGAGARALASVPFERLRVLDLRDNQLTAAGAKALAASPNLAQLEALYLHQREIGRVGARALADSPHLPFRLRRHWSALASADREPAPVE